jgi:hypothetical protein
LLTTTAMAGLEEDHLRRGPMVRSQPPRSMRSSLPNRIYTFLLGGMTLGVSTVFVQVEEALQTSALIMNGGSAVQIFFLGIGNVFFVPLTHSKLTSIIKHAC